MGQALKDLQKIATEPSSKLSKEDEVKRFLCQQYGLKEDDSRLQLLYTIYEDIRSRQEPPNLENELLPTQITKLLLQKQGEIQRVVMSQHLMRPQKTLILYSKILEEVLTCYNSNKAVGRLDRGMNRMLDEIAYNERDAAKRTDLQVSKELMTEMMRAIGLKKDERRLLALERDCQRLQDLHDNIEWDTNDAKVQLIKARLGGKDVRSDTCQLTKPVMLDAIKSVQI